MLSRLWLTLWIVVAATGAGLGGLGLMAAEEEFDRQPAPYGVWMPEDEASKIKFYACDDAICGRVVWLEDEYDEDGNLLTDIYNPDPDLRSAPVLGLRVMSDVKPTEDAGVWRGRVYNPQDGRTYDFWLTVETESRIVIEGCGLYNLICQKHTWTRVDDQLVGSGQQ